MNILETERLILREFTLDDAPFVLDLVNDPSWLRFIGDRGVKTLADARAFVEGRLVASYKQFGFGFYLTQLKVDNVAIGMCGLIKRQSLPDVDIGFAFLPQFTGLGYAFEAATAVMNYGKKELGLNRIVAITDPDNVRSIHLLHKLGLQFEKMVRLSEDEPEILLLGPVDTEPEK